MVISSYACFQSGNHVVSVRAVRGRFVGQLCLCWLLGFSLFAYPQDHWSFKPVRDPETPRLGGTNPLKHGVDAFIETKLKQANLSATAPADRRTLLRRASYDLTGLPPTPEEVRAFEADTDNDAFGKVVDRLLESPRYGERWGRHWLDVARYADTTGERAVRNSETRYPYAYTYRDYVIRSFNEDKPYDRFIMEQIAGDLLDLSNDPRAIAALGFLTVGKRFRNSEDDIVDDRIDVVTRGLQGLSVSCARCHDHKFDPIPTEDYYSLHGIFTSCEEPELGPLLSVDSESPSYRDFIEKLSRLEEALDRFRTEVSAELLKSHVKRAVEYLEAVQGYLSGDKKLSANNYYRSKKLDPNLARRWEQELRRRSKGFDSVFTPFFLFAEVDSRSFEAEASGVFEKLFSHSNGHKLNPLVAGQFQDCPSSRGDVFRRYERIFSEVQPVMNPVKSTADSRERRFEAGFEALHELLFGESGIYRLDPRSLNRLMSQKMQREENALVKRMNDLRFEHPGSPARAMVLSEKEKPRNSYVYLKGEKSGRGPIVPRRYLQVIQGPHRESIQSGSGRLELAKAITDPSNPLTARVMVNRIWMWHFGQGLVETPSDFGLRGEPPTHPELLDWLASRFMESGWSIKAMHRLIMLSEAYCRSDETHDEGIEKDPGNALYWRFNSRRLDFEAIRDTLLFVSGTLDETCGGRPVRLDVPPYSTRRSVYGFVDRLDLSDMYLTFDFANPEMTCAKRFETIVPQQALFMMNHPFVLECVKGLVERKEFKGQIGFEAQVTWLHQNLFQRNPEPEEIKLALDFIESQSNRLPEEQPLERNRGGRRATQIRSMSPLEIYVQALIVSNEAVLLN